MSGKRGAGSGERKGEIGKRKGASRQLQFRAMAMLALAFSVVSLPLPAQVNPSHSWYSVRTPHFIVHFTRPLEPLARRLAGHAERAYAELSKELHPPRGMIDLVVTDDADRSNGSATPFPTNRIVIFANPPVSETGLRYTNDWGAMVVTHELTHIFHLDRTRGVWALAQTVFGRAALAFPNIYQPSWLTEGLAVYEETRVAGAGRVEGSENRMIARATAVNRSFPSIGALSLSQGRFPFGSSAYAYGSLFLDYLARTRGESRIRAFVDKSAANPIPYLIDIPARQAFDVSFTRGWKDFRDSVARTLRVSNAPPLRGWRELTHDGVFVFGPRWLSDSSLVYAGSTGRESFGAYTVDLDGHRTRIGRRNSRSANVPLAGGSLLFAQLEFTNLYEERSDLWVQRGRGQHRLTRNQRLASPDARADGEIVAVQIMPGATRLVRVSRDGATITPLTNGGFDEQWTEPRWSHAGDRIAASRWLRGNISQIVIIDTTGGIVHTVSSGTSIEGTPSWLPGDSGVMYSSDRTGAAQAYVQRFEDPGTFAGAATFRLSDVTTGLFEPNPAPATPLATAVVFRADGYHLGAGACCSAGERVADYRDTVSRYRPAPSIPDTTHEKKFSPWRTLLPRYWLPTIDQGIRNGYRIGAMTSGADVIGRHSFSAAASLPTDNLGGLVGNFSYDYSGLGLPIIQADAYQDWESLGGISNRLAPQTILGELFRRTWGGDLLATWARAGYRSALSASVGPSGEYRSHFTTPGNLIAAIDSSGQFGNLFYPSVVGSVSFANYQRPPYAISLEDGVQATLTVRDRVRSGPLATGGQSFSTVGVANIYKSLNLPGFAHHVIALRGAGGFADSRASGYYSVGGASGNPFTVVPGYVLGEGRKTFPVRGFSSGSIIGTRALAGSVEYRAPLVLVGGAPRTLPFFLDRTSLTLFGDYGTAWCPSVSRTTEVCNRAGQDRRSDIGSVGAELIINLGVLSWDAPYLFRIGVVHPVQNAAAFRRNGMQMYLVSGASY